MKNHARVFLDTTVAHHSFTSRTVIASGRGVVQIDPTSHIEGKLRHEIDLLADIARLAKNGSIDLLWSSEIRMELLQISLFPDSCQSELLSAPIQRIKEPVTSNRILCGPPHLRLPGPKAGQIDFLRSINHDRYSQLKQICGVPSDDGKAQNQLADAYHIWCAEHAGASHFLTTDFKLNRLARQKRKGAQLLLKVVTPSELLTDLGMDPANGP